MCVCVCVCVVVSICRWQTHDITDNSLSYVSEPFDKKVSCDYNSDDFIHLPHRILRIILNIREAITISML